MTTVEAETTLAEARATRNGLAKRQADATQALRDAQAARAKLVAAIAAGQTVETADQAAVQAAMDDANLTSALTQDAVAGADAAIADAEHQLHLARQTEWESRMADLIAARVAAAARLDDAFQKAREALAEFSLAGDTLNACTTEGAHYRTKFHVVVNGVRMPRGAGLRLDVELTAPSGVLDGRKPFWGRVEAVERAAWGL